MDGAPDCMLIASWLHAAGVDAAHKRISRSSDCMLIAFLIRWVPSRRRRTIESSSSRSWSQLLLAFCHSCHLASRSVCALLSCTNLLTNLLGCCDSAPGMALNLTLCSALFSAILENAEFANGPAGVRARGSGHRRTEIGSEPNKVKPSEEGGVRFHRLSKQP